MESVPDVVPETQFASGHTLTGCGASLPCDPRRWLHRYLMLFFICFLSFGSYFCYDNPAALQDVIIRDLSLTETEFMNLYSWYSWPTVVMCFVGGFLIDRVFGVPLGAIIFSACVLIGQLLFGIGAFVNSLGLIYFARFVFGIGGECLGVAQNTYVTEWFTSSELNFVFGLQLSMARLGSTVNMNTMQPLYRAISDRYQLIGYRNLGAALLVAAVTCVFSSICALVLGYFTKRAKRILGGHLATDPYQIPTTSGSPNPTQRISFHDILHFPAALWLICIICVTYYVAVFPFISLGLLFFERKFFLSVKEASVLNSLVFILSAIASPLFGAAIDYTGRNLHWVLTGISMSMVCHLCFAFTSGALPPAFLTVLLGISYSILASSLWPLVAYFLPVHQRGTAYGLIQALQNLGLGVVSILAGFLVDNKGYLILEVFFTFCLSLSLAFTFVLYIWDQWNDNLLNESGVDRRSRQTFTVFSKTTTTSDE